MNKAAKLLLSLAVCISLSMILLVTFVFCNGVQWDASQWEKGAGASFSILITLIWFAYSALCIYAIISDDYNDVTKL